MVAFDVNVRQPSPNKPVPPKTPSPTSPRSKWNRVRLHIRARLATARALHLHFALPHYAILGSYNGAKDYLRKLRIGVVQRGLSEGVLTDIKVKHEADEATALVDTGAVVTVHSSGASNVAMWQQGDASLSTTEKLRDRKALRRDERVAKAINCFWQTALRSEGHTVAHPEDHEEKLATRECYECIFLRAYKVLLDEWDPEDAKACIAEDWENDARGAPGLTNVTFGDALFQVADLWVASIDGGDYADFLWKLFRAVTIGGTMFKGLDDFRPVYRWKPLEECCFNEELVGDGGRIDVHEELVGDDDHERNRSSKTLGKKAKENRDRRRAAKKIQAVRRGANARREREMRKRASVEIQTCCRGKLSRKRMHVHRLQKHEEELEREDQYHPAWPVVSRPSMQELRRTFDWSPRPEHQWGVKSPRWVPVTPRSTQGSDFMVDVWRSGGNGALEILASLDRKDKVLRAQRETQVLRMRSKNPPDRQAASRPSTPRTTTTQLMAARRQQRLGLLPDIRSTPTSPRSAT